MLGEVGVGVGVGVSVGGEWAGLDWAGCAVITLRR